ncbi:PREDICTED: 5-hydroxytryptamine receptor 3B [Crocodylus porosus]|uniref:5-hydroxytryptamine receptor 3B n=1 Tax=Crocodylus porosus TaxID=8502 RepID=UPI00093B3767|nr:PREDICTED: 5-hydroxytryptamine receptor 3B [Crocodylus porosus]
MPTGSITLFLLLLLGLLATGSSSAVAGCARNSTLHRLTRRLLRNYSKGVRPVRNWAQATTVYLDLFVHAVLDVDSQNQKLTTSIWLQQSWKDEFLTWNSSLHDGIREVSLLLSSIWSPDITINELVDVSKSLDIPYVYVNASGMVRNQKPMQVVSACQLELYAFPFDTQTCSLTFSTILHTVEDVDLAAHAADNKQIFLADGEWELLSVPSRYQVLSTHSGRYAEAQFHIVIRRRPLLYVISLLIPSIFLMAVDLGSFYLPPTCGTRITFKGSMLVGYTVFKVNMLAELPGAALGTPLIGVFFTVCMALLVLSLSLSILLVKCLHPGKVHAWQRLTSHCCRGESGSDGEDRGANSQAAPAARQAPGCTEGAPLPGEAAVQGEEGRWEGMSTQKAAMEEILAQLLLISSRLRALDRDSRQEADWLRLSYKLDALLFQVYAGVVAIYAITLGALWVTWSSQQQEG